MAGRSCFQDIQEGDNQESCDGCVHLHPVSELIPIGDGSIRVCRACYADATAMVLPSEIPAAQTSGNSDGSANRIPRRKRIAFGA